MAQQLAPRSVVPSVCSQSPYAQFLPLKAFPPAVTFCSIYLAESKLPPISGCPNGNALCSVLSSLSKCDLAFISTVCTCIESGSTVTTTISVPKSTTPSTTKTTAKSSLSTKTISPSSSAKSTPTTLAASTTSSVATPSYPAPAPPDPSCTVVTAPDGEFYAQYYSGQYFIEYTDNPGNYDPDFPPITYEFPGTLDMCDAAQACADSSDASPGEYLSFDLHYLTSTGLWECVAYKSVQNDPSYFNVSDSNALYAFGYFGCC